MKILIISDLHIKEKYLDELEEIFTEIIQIKETNQVTEVWLLGDTFDCVRPTSLEMDCFARFIKHFDKAIILAAKSHESINEEQNVLNHFSILNPQYQVFYHQHIVEYSKSCRIFLGHFTLNESIHNEGATVSASELKKYRFSFLGHSHTFQYILESIYHLGSIRFISFAESPDPKKYVGILEINDFDKTFTPVALKSPIPMIDIILKANNSNDLDKKSLKNSISDPQKGDNGTLMPESSNLPVQSTYVFEGVAALLSFLAQLPAKTKVRLLIEDFDAFKEYLPYENLYEKKFYVYKRENRFSLETTTQAAAQGEDKKKNLEQSLGRFLEAKKPDPEIRKIIEEEIK